ncbi:hypothetical protein [Kitasatospora sp. MAA4]|uniref:hypothetical protein n=1 Tax=Kitasatospora sp. MAA4 TaxID=3035093 RepID=UPI0024741812|nr:hypothetical protein [Kitasatospora sp. MAA4]
MSSPISTLLNAAMMAAVFGAWYAVAITLIALAAVAARTPERRHDARDVLKILVRRNTR